MGEYRTKVEMVHDRMYFIQNTCFFNLKVPNSDCNLELLNEFLKQPFVLRSFINV